LYKRIPTQILVAAFSRLDGAEKALNLIGQAMAEAEGYVVCTNAAVVKKLEDGKLRVTELGNPGLLKGMAGGTAAGAAVGAGCCR